VRIGTGERAELGTNEFFPYQTVLEGLVILKRCAKPCQHHAKAEYELIACRNEGYDAEDASA
jgi:hypothetical protein